MRIDEFLALMLEAYGRSLRAASEILGEQPLLAALGRLDAPESPSDSPAAMDLIGNEPIGDAPMAGPDAPSPYERLDAAVGSLGLSGEFEHAVWSFPVYRMYTETGVELTAPVERPGAASAVALAEETVALAESWLTRLARSADASDEAAGRLIALSRPHWLRFRTEVLRRQGHSPFRIT